MWKKQQAEGLVDKAAPRACQQQFSASYICIHVPDSCQLDCFVSSGESLQSPMFPFQSRAEWRERGGIILTSAAATYLILNSSASS